MANSTSAAGNNGVAGNYVYEGVGARVVTGTYGTTYSDADDRAVTDNHAVRRSVSKTRSGYGSAVNASNVYSETQNMRMAYSGVEADSPALAASRTAI